VTERAAILCERIVLGVLLTGFVVVGGGFLLFAVAMSRWNCGGDLPFAMGNQPGAAKFNFHLPAMPEQGEATIYYFLSGPFGGYGSFAEVEPGVQECEVEVGNTRALKAIVYRAGHGFALVSAPSLTNAASRSVTVDLPPPLASVPLHGKIAQMEGKNLTRFQVEVRYEPGWDSEFFGGIDRMPASLKVATAEIAADGSFTAMVPDFTQDAVVQQFQPLVPDGLTLILREIKTGHVPYTLELVSKTGAPDKLKLAGEYPELVIFWPKLW
jgi:hypothetical protein